MLSEIKQLIAILDQFPHRGFGSVQEKTARERLQQHLQKDKFSFETYPARSIPSGLIAYFLLFMLFILGLEISILIQSRTASFTFLILALCLYLRFPGVIGTLITRLLGKDSENLVITTGDDAATMTLVISSHFDSPQQIPLLNRIKKLPGYSSIFTSHPLVLKLGIITPVIPMLLILAVGELSGLRVLSLTAVAFTFLLCLILAMILLGPDVQGANDNASGVIANLVLAKKLKRFPLDGVRTIHIINTGEETIPRTLDKTMRELGLYKSSTMIINLEMLACAKLRALDGEIDYTGMFLRYSRRLLAASGLPLSQKSLQYHGIATQGTDAGELVKKGWRVLTTFISEDPGQLGRYHQTTDTFTNLNKVNLEENINLIEKFIREYNWFSRY